MEIETETRIDFDYRQTLREIFDLMDFGRVSGSVKKWTVIAERLSFYAGKSPPWGWRYAQSVAAGTGKIHQPMKDAITKLAASMDGMSPVQAMASPRSNIMAIDDDFLDGTVVEGKTKICAYCGGKFCPVVPWAKYHQVCAPMAYKLQAKLKREAARKARSDD